ncbi:uncharacterized protein J3R85_012784 [Psidium guajava]|nr:uncharacterized protein J3R85_012784 [Psidium guajava]
MSQLASRHLNHAATASCSTIPTPPPPPRTPSNSTSAPPYPVVITLLKPPFNSTVCTGIPSLSPSTVQPLVDATSSHLYHAPLRAVQPLASAQPVRSKPKAISISPEIV